MHFDRITTLGDILDLNASAFLNAATKLARLHQVFHGLSQFKEDVLVQESIWTLDREVKSFKIEAEQIGARLAVVLADRFIERLSAVPCVVTVAQATGVLSEIESRFADYLVEIRLFVLYPQEVDFMNRADVLANYDGFSLKFPKVAFEVEEAGKCYALGRYTACVFHAMRMLELGLGALSTRLGIDDPSKPSEKNWGKILEKIRLRVDELWPKRNRSSGSEGAAFDELYANLEAVRNPWRNATMHVETIYAPHEALHILRCTVYFLLRLGLVCNEEGVAPDGPGFGELMLSEP